MADEEKKDQVEEVKEVADKAENSAEKAEESAEKAEVAAEKVEEIKEEVKKEVKEEKAAPVEEKKEKPVPSGKFKEVIEKIEGLSVLELAELVKELEDRFGVSASAPMMAMPAAGAAGAVPVEEEKSSYDVILASAGDKKIQVIKAVREIKPELGLKEAKDLVDAAPKEVAKGVKKEEAEEAKKKLEAAGATVELK